MVFRMLTPMDDLEQRIHGLFAEEGPLWSHPDFERRVQQKEMAVAIARTFANGGHLLVEAPTGVGKTLAYLLPAILHARATEQRVVVSTHTKNLQDQLLFKDIPLAASILQTPFSVFALKGRRNYICTTRLRAALAATGSLFDEAQEAELRRIFQWSLESTDGDLSTLGFVPKSDVWDAVCSDPGVCSAATCKSDCAYQRARQKARSADLLIVNHALFFSHFALSRTDEEQNDLAGTCTVFDEAHTLENVAAKTLGKSVSRRQLMSVVNRLYNRRTKHGLIEARGRRTSTIFRHVEETIDDFFSAVRRGAEHTGTRGGNSSGSESREVRIRTSHLTADTITAPLGDLQHEIERWADETADSSRAQEFLTTGQTIEEARLFIEEFLHRQEEGLAYWVEVGPPPNDNVSMSAAPIHIGSIVGPRLFSGDASVIMTSATLSVNNSLEYVQHRFGAEEASTLILDSPFDFQRQMRIALSRSMPEPDSKNYASALTREILKAVDRTDGRALVLFTSNVMLRLCARTIEPQLADRGIQLLVQGIEWDRHQLLQEFKRDVRSVLFGLDSFWMGVDVPGEALEHVIITRLPFSVPTQPLIQARLEEIEARGGKPFFEYSLPEAILKFRQGVGRLIRTQTDRGLITILDSRIISKVYGRMFLNSLPKCTIEVDDGEGFEDLQTDDPW
jgi:ATP-dependent DNA helicase DinG